MHRKYTLPGSTRPVIVRYSTKQLATDKSDPGPFKLYVSNLSKSTTEDEIRAMFSAYGTLIDDVVILKGKRTHAQPRIAAISPASSPLLTSRPLSRLLSVFGSTDQHTLVSKGVAFVRFNTRAEASLAIQSLHEQIRDKDAPHLMQVKFAHSTAEKKLLLSSGGVLPLHRMGMPGSSAAQQQMAGYYPGSHFNPAAGYGGQQGGYNPYGAPPHMQGAGAGYHHYGGQGPSHNGHSGGGGSGGSNRAPITKGPEGANLFVYGIPESYSDSDLSALFTHFGTVINAKVYRDLSTLKSKGFGFVSFDSVPNANQAVQQMNGYMIQGRKINVKPKTEGSSQQQHNGGGGMQQHSHMGQPQHHHQQPPHQQPPHLQHQQQQAHPQQHAMAHAQHQQQQMAMQHGTHAQAQLQAYYAQLAAQQQAALQQQQQQQQSNGQVQPSQSPIPASSRANGQPQQQQQAGYAGSAY